MIAAVRAQGPHEEKPEIAARAGAPKLPPEAARTDARTFHRQARAAAVSKLLRLSR